MLHHLSFSKTRTSVCGRAGRTDGLLLGHLHHQCHRVPLLLPLLRLQEERQRRRLKPRLHVRFYAAFWHCVFAVYEFGKASRNRIMTLEAGEFSETTKTQCKNALWNRTCKWYFKCVPLRDIYTCEMKSNLSNTKFGWNI